MKKTAIFLLFAAFALPAADPPGYFQWTPAELKTLGQSLKGKMSAQKVASQQLTNFGNYSFMAAHREGPGEAELHELQADVFVVRVGEATLVIGGKMENGKTTAPNEIRAPSISGGTEKKIAAGDIVAIPAKMPHQLKITPGKEFDYFIVKITQP